MSTNQLRRAIQAYEEAARCAERAKAQLDRQFAEQTVTSDSLDAVTAEIGSTRAALRATHLRYHLSTKEILTAEQVANYADLRGYRTDEPHRPGGHQHGAHGH